MTKIQSNWKILRQAVLYKQLPTSNPSDSTTQSRHDFNPFNQALIISHHVSCEDGGGGCRSIKYTFDDTNQLLITYPEPKYTLPTGAYTGFLNTGMMRVWHAEEHLALYAIRFLDFKHVSKVCELGSGPTGLAGLALASVIRSAGEQCKLILTDGNPECTPWLYKNIGASQLENAEARVLLWKRNAKYTDLDGKLDTVLASDCLYDCSVHEDLIWTLKSLLKDGGRAFLMAPSRGASFDAFCALVDMDNVLICASDHQWNEYLMQQAGHAVQDPRYDADIHLPRLVIVSKQSRQ